MYSNTKAAYFNGDIFSTSVCLSSDTKPTVGIQNGSICIEMDTGKIYFFDEDNHVWRALA